jgi:hypothetical protein
MRAAAALLLVTVAQLLRAPAAFLVPMSAHSADLRPPACFQVQREDSAHLAARLDSRSIGRNRETRITVMQSREGGGKGEVEIVPLHAHTQKGLNTSPGLRVFGMVTLDHQVVVYHGVLCVPSAKTKVRERRIQVLSSGSLITLSARSASILRKRGKCAPHDLL